MECESCGIIFERYKVYKKKQQEKEQSLANTETSSPSRSRTFTILAASLLVAITAGTTYYFTQDQTTTNPSRQPIATEKTDLSEQVNTGPIEPDILTDTSSGEQANEVFDPKQAIANALKATVKIQTEWGTGSGFYITDSFIVTNRHVVQAKKEDFTEERKQIDNLKRLVELEKQKIRELVARRNAMAKGPGRKQLSIIIKEHKRQLAKILPELKQREQQLTEKENAIRTAATITVFMSDGTEYSGYLSEISDNYDLALISTSNTEHSKIPLPPPGSRLKQGDKVYTIGSPVGLQNTVTAGIFSSYRQHNNDPKVYLQTDAAINPGNSGGPLIDERGYVYGINTMILSNTEGIGFAIPVEEVFNDFGASIY